MVTEYLIAVIWGILITLFLEIIAVLVWFYSIADVAPSRTIPANASNRTITPEAVDRSCYDGREDDTPTEDEHRSESCDWLNSLVDFLFHQLRDSPELKKMMMKQINKEFMEILLTKTQGKMLERLSVREYSMGTSLPVLSNIVVVKAKQGDDDKPTLVEIEMDIDYSGGFQLSIDADLVFNKAAFMSVQVNLIRGRGRLQFTTASFTHWSFAFVKEPQMDLSVWSRFEGRELKQLSTFLKAQIIRWVRRLHTLPNHKVRFKPFFQKIIYQDQLTDVHMHNSLLTRGELTVKIIDCNRLVLPDAAVELYCTASVDNAPIDSQIGVWQKAWPSREVSVCRNPSNSLGMKYEMFSLNDDGKKNLLVVTHITQHSPSHQADIRAGDIIQKIDNINVVSVHQADKLIRNTRTERLLVLIRRPTVDILKILEQQQANKEEHKKENKKKGKRGRSKSPSRHKISKTSTPAPEIVILEGNEATSTPQPSLLERDDHDHYSDDDRLTEMNDRDAFDMLQDHNRPASLGHRNVLMKERAMSTPPAMEEDGHRPLATSLDPSDLVTSLPGRSLQSPLPTSSVTPEAAENTSNKVSHDYALQSHDSHTTKSVSVSKNPSWNEEFQYLLTSKNRYLNVCVWCKLQGEHKNFMIGCATMSLTDIALECAVSGIHKQRYVLLPTKDMKTSKLALKALTELPANAKMGAMNEVPKYVGDICLVFMHEPMETPVTTETSNEELGDSFSNTDIELTFKNHHPFTAKAGTEPQKHEFLMKSNLKGNCYVCQKMIKRKLMRCCRCGILAHDKSCVPYCKNMVKCKILDEHLHVERDQSWVELNSMGEQLYSVSKQQPYYKEDRISLEDVPLEDPLTEATMPFEESCTTPPPPPESCSESDDEEPEIHRKARHYIEVTDGFVDITTPQELENKILDATKQLETLAENKRTLKLDPSISQENLDFKLKKYDAQIETTEVKLNQYKDKLRKISP